MSSKTRSSIGKKARRKGASFERDVAKLISRWWGKTFSRVPQSGGNAGLKGMGIAGDLMTDSSDFPFHCELKNVDKPVIEQFLLAPKGGLLVNWIKQCKRDCPPGKIPLVIFKKNYSPPCFALCIPSSDSSSIPYDSSSNFPLKVFYLAQFLESSLDSYWCSRREVLIGRLEDLTKVSKEDLILSMLFQD